MRVGALYFAAFLVLFSGKDLKAELCPMTRFVFQEETVHFKTKYRLQSVLSQSE